MLVVGGLVLFFKGGLSNGGENNGGTNIDVTLPSPSPDNSGNNQPAG